MKREYWYCQIVLFLLIGFSCKDDPKPQQFIDQETKDFCFFNLNSQWIYFEESLNLIDSQTVIKSKNEFVMDEESTFDYELAIMNIRSTQHYRIGGLNDGVAVYKINPRDPGDEFKDFVSFVANDVIVGRNYITYFAIEKELSPFSDSVIDLEIRYGKLDSLNVLGTIFHEVKVFEFTKSAPGTYPKKTYWVKHVGRIRYEFHNGEVWNLKSFSVSQ